MNKSVLLPLMVISVLILSACESPSAQPTSTSAPTTSSVQAEPTQVPYELSVTVTDKAGVPITWASGVIQNSGTNLSKTADGSGQLVWKNMTNPGDLLSVEAQGYKPVQQTLSLVQGPNDVSIVLEEDPTQLNPGKACQPGQEALYVEDFEDGQAQDLQNVDQPKWTFVNVPDRGTVLSVNAPGGNASMTGQTEFGNAVWMFDLSTSGLIDVDFNWHLFETTEGGNAGISRYYVVYRPGELFELNYVKPGEGSKLTEAASPVFEAESWHKFAIAYFDGTLSVWVDGQQAMSATQDLPIPKGRLGVQINAATQAEIKFDNFIVCELSAPYSVPTLNP